MISNFSSLPVNRELHLYTHLPFISRVNFGYRAWWHGEPLTRAWNEDDVCGASEHRGGAAAGPHRRQEVRQGGGLRVRLQHCPKVSHAWISSSSQLYQQKGARKLTFRFQANGEAAISNTAHPQHQQHHLHGRLQDHQRRPQGPLGSPQELPRGQPAVIVTVNSQFYCNKQYCRHSESWKLNSIKIKAYTFVL